MLWFLPEFDVFYGVFGSGPAHAVISRNLSFDGREDAVCKTLKSGWRAATHNAGFGSYGAREHLQGGCDHQNIFLFTRRGGGVIGRARHRPSTHSRRILDSSGSTGR
jgi:hypothetical protein